MAVQLIRIGKVNESSHPNNKTKVTLISQLHENQSGQTLVKKRETSDNVCWINKDDRRGSRKYLGCWKKNGEPEDVSLSERIGIQHTVNKAEKKIKLGNKILVKKEIILGEQTETRNDLR